jgi:hypothetical protein
MEEDLVTGSRQLQSIIMEMEHLTSEFTDTQWKTDIRPQGQIAVERLTTAIQSNANTARASAQPTRQQPKPGATQDDRNKVSKPHRTELGRATLSELSRREPYLPGAIQCPACATMHGKR